MGYVPYLAKWNNISPTTRFPWHKGSHFPYFSPPFGGWNSVMEVLYNLTISTGEHRVVFFHQQDGMTSFWERAIRIYVHKSIAVKMKRMFPKRDYTLELTTGTYKSPIKRKENDRNQTSREVNMEPSCEIFFRGVFFCREYIWTNHWFSGKHVFFCFQGSHNGILEKFPFLFHCLLGRVGGGAWIFLKQKSIQCRTTHSWNACWKFSEIARQFSYELRSYLFRIFFLGVSITWCGRNSSIDIRYSYVDSRVQMTSNTV